jgi:hypothetical protein
MKASMSRSVEEHKANKERRIKGDSERKQFTVMTYKGVNVLEKGTRSWVGRGSARLGGNT